MELGPYTVSHVLGEGGSGTVYAARTGGRDVALKVLRADAELTPKEVERFLAEAERMRRVAHPSVAGVLDAGLLPDGRPFIAMPLLSGETLATRLERGRLPLDETLAIFTQLAEGLVAIHQAGLVHRDVKPENVFVTNAMPPRAMLLDLGIARDLWAAPSTTTQAGRVRGTPAYMAPERFFGKPAGIETDVYELAVVLYVMLTGRLPWTDVSDRSHALPPASAGVILPNGVSTTLMRALAPRPDERPASVKALLVELEAALTPELALLAGRTTTQALAQPTAGDAGVQGLAGTPPRSMPPAPSSSTPIIALGVAGVLGLAVVGGWLWQRRGATSPTVADAPARETASSASPAASVALSTSSSPSVSSASPTAPTPAPTPSSKPAPKPPGTATASAPLAPTPAASAGDGLASCRAVSEVYCSEDWKKTESPPGQQCRAWQANVQSWATKPAVYRQAMAESCPGIRAQAVNVLAQRKAQLANGTAPPRP